MQTIQGSDELEGALTRSVTSIGGAKCESLMAARVPFDSVSASGGVGSGGTATDEQAHRPRHNKSSQLLMPGPYTGPYYQFNG